ncbi:MAG: hypothetical protein RL240_1455 [Planctomycetota bacterium]|jgi:hypothetical protein
MKKGVTKKAAAKKAAPKTSAVKKGAKTPATTTNKLLDKKLSSKKTTKKRKPGKSNDEEGGCVSPSFVKTSASITIETITPGFDFLPNAAARVDIGQYDPINKKIKVTVIGGTTSTTLDVFGFQVSSEPVGGPVEYYPFSLEYASSTPKTGFLKLNTTAVPVAANLRVTILTKKKVAP